MHDTGVHPFSHVTHARVVDLSPDLVRHHRLQGGGGGILELQQTDGRMCLFTFLA